MTQRYVFEAYKNMRKKVVPRSDVLCLNVFLFRRRMNMRLDMPTIQTKRLRLRPVEIDDASDMYEYYKDTHVMKYMSVQTHKDIDETLHMLKCWELPYEKRGVPQTWVIELLQEDKVIGHLNIHTIEDEIGEIGYMLHPRYWHQGIMKEAIRELIVTGFEHIGLRRIEALCAVEHIYGIKLLSACGFIKEGVFRQYAMLQDKSYHDMVMMSILKEEWQKHTRRTSYEKDIRSKI